MGINKHMNCLPNKGRKIDRCVHSDPLISMLAVRLEEAYKHQNLSFLNFLGQRGNLDTFSAYMQRQFGIAYY